MKKHCLFRCRFCKEFERHFCMKIIVTIILTNSVANSLLFLFWPFIETKNKVFRGWSSGSEKIILLFVDSRALFQRYVEFNRLSEKNFLTCYSCSYYSSMIHYKLLLFSSGANSGCKNSMTKLTSRSCYVLPPSKQKDFILSGKSKKAWS